MRIGILEDYQSLGRILHLSLGLAGYTVHTSENIIDFLAFMASPTPADLIIVDFRLLAEHREIRLSGADVIRHLRTITPDLPAILISAAPLATLEAATADLSRVKLLQKPFKTSTLLEMVRIMVETDERARDMHHS
jgi:DNA-binding NtrC family response regulator